MKLKVEMESEKDVENIVIKVKYADNTYFEAIQPGGGSSTMKQPKVYKEGVDDAFNQSY